MAYITNFEKVAMEKGRQIGMLQYARELVIEELEEKFNVVPKEIQGKLQGIEEKEVLRKLLRQAIRASSLEEFLEFMQK